jgi:transposase
VLVLWRLWEKLGLHQLLQECYQKTLVEFPVEEAIFGMVLNRLVDADSKLGAYDWLKEKVFRPELEDLELHHLYRALDFLEEHIKAIEEALFVTEREMFNLEVDLVFFDTTSTYFERQGSPGLAERGYSRDKRSDLKQVIIGLVMTREGIPVAHHVFHYAVADLKRRFTVRRVVIVADRGVVSEPLLEALQAEGQEYIVGISLHKWRAAGKVLARPGRYHEVADNLRVKEVWLDGRRYVLCHNPEREVEDARRRAEIVSGLKEELTHGGLSKLAKKKGYGRYLKIEEKGTAGINWRRVEHDTRYDGKYLLRTPTDFPSEQVALAYKELWRVAHAFRDLKSGLEVRPVYHWTPSRVRGHVGACFLALVMESVLSRLLRAQGCEESLAKVMEAVQPLPA